MYGQTFEILLHSDSRRRAGMKPCETAVAQWDLIVVLDKLHEHARYQYDEIGGIDKGVVSWKDLRCIRL